MVYPLCLRAAIRSGVPYGHVPWLHPTGPAHDHGEAEAVRKDQNARPDCKTHWRKRLGPIALQCPKDDGCNKDYAEAEGRLAAAKPVH